MSTKAFAISLLTSLSLLTAGCGNVHQGPSPSLVTIVSLEGAPGNTPTAFGTNLLSDVITVVPDANKVPVPTIFNDLGRVSVSLALKNQSASGPSPLNTVTFTHYHVEYRRTDGHNIEGVDVPYSFDSGLTFSVSGTAQFGFELVRNSAKQEAPLRALASGTFTVISTIANVTFYGKDQAGNNVSVTGSMSIDFGNFADPATS